MIGCVMIYMRAGQIIVEYALQQNIQCIFWLRRFTGVPNGDMSVYRFYELLLLILKILDTNNSVQYKIAEQKIIVYRRWGKSAHQYIN